MVELRDSWCDKDLKEKKIYREVKEHYLKDEQLSLELKDWGGWLI